MMFQYEAPPPMNPPAMVLITVDFGLIPSPTSVGSLFGKEV